MAKLRHRSASSCWGRLDWSLHCWAPILLRLLMGASPFTWLKDHIHRGCTSGLCAKRNPITTQFSIVWAVGIIIISKGCKKKYIFALLSSSSSCSYGQTHSANLVATVLSKMSLYQQNKLPYRGKNTLQVTDSPINFFHGYNLAYLSVAQGNVWVMEAWASAKEIIYTKPINGKQRLHTCHRNLFSPVWW